MDRVSVIFDHLFPPSTGFSSSKQPTSNCVILEENGDVLKVVLNNMKSFNALTLEMVNCISEAVIKAEDRVKVILLQGSRDQGCFCAGGDVKFLVQNIRNHGDVVGVKKSLRFIIDEAFCISTIAKAKVPVVAFWDGMTFGGGVGISIVAPYRVVTERIKFAMPEVNIGFFPGLLFTLHNLNGSYHHLHFQMLAFLWFFPN